MLYVIISLIVGLVVYLVFSGSDDDDRESPIARLARMKHGAAKSDENAAQDGEKISVLIQETEYKIEALGNFLTRFNFFNVIRRQLKIADINIAPDMFIVISIIPAFGLSIFGIVFFKSFVFVFIILSTVWVIFPSIMLKVKIKKRLAMFTQQFPDALDLISSTLRAGHSLLSAFQMVAREMPEPVNLIFKNVSEDIALGRDTREALNNMTEFMPMSIDLKFFVTAVLIQREIGGNLAEILDSLNITIRERFKLLGQIATQTAQAQLSGVILALAPVFIAGIIYLMNPTYLDPLLKTLPGLIVLGIAISMAGLGYLVINKITNIRV